MFWDDFKNRYFDIRAFSGDFNNWKIDIRVLLDDFKKQWIDSKAFYDDFKNWRFDIRLLSGDFISGSFDFIFPVLYIKRAGTDINK